MEFDLHRFLNLDLLDFFRGIFTWDKFLRLVALLPSGSAYWAARADDDDLADMMVSEMGDGQGKGTVPLGEMTRPVQVLMDVADGLSAVIGRLDALLGEPGKVEAYPRPETAMVRARDRLRLSLRSDLLGEIRAAQGK